MAGRYPAIWLLLALVSGILLTDWIQPRYWLILVPGVAIVTGALLVPRKALMLIGSLAGIALFSGFDFSLHHSSQAYHQLADIAQQSQRYTVCGEVDDWPRLRSDRTELVIAVDSITHPVRRAVNGRILLKISATTTALQRGDHLRFQARLYPVSSLSPGGTFNYRRHLQHQGIQAVAFLPTLLNVQIDSRPTLGLLPAADDVRAFVIATFENTLTPESAALARGYLLGDTRNIDPETYRKFRDTGTLHVMAVSGSNVALVLAFIHFLLKPAGVRRAWRYSILLTVIPLYAIMCYGEPSVIRASVMAALVVVGRLLGRKLNLNNIISLAACLILLVDPSQLFNVGFQLSFATAWGLIFVVPRIGVLFGNWKTRRWYRWIVFPLIIALVAQVVSTPLIAFHFQRVPAVSLPANLIIVPLVSIATFGLLLLPIASLILPLLGKFLGSLVNPLVSATARTLDSFHGESVIVLRTEQDWFGLPPAIACLTIYALLFVGTLAVSSLRARRIFVLLCSLTALIVSAGTASRFWTNQDGTVICEPIPGGVAVIIQPSASHMQSGRADLVLTGMLDRDYPIDERILEPQLRSRGVRQIGSLIVLSADYGALDDIFRLAQRYSIDHLSFHENLRSSVNETGLVSADSADNRPIVSYQSAIMIDPADSGHVVDLGYVLTPDGLWLSLPERKLFICPRYPHEGLRTSGPDEGGILILGSAWYPTVDDWLSLRNRGWDLIAAPKIRAAGGDSARSAITGSETEATGLPDFLVDLRQAGPLVLTLR